MAALELILTVTVRRANGSNVQIAAFAKLHDQLIADLGRPRRESPVLALSFYIVSCCIVQLRQPLIFEPSPTLLLTNVGGKEQPATFKQNGVAFAFCF